MGRGHGQARDGLRDAEERVGTWCQELKSFLFRKALWSFQRGSKSREALSHFLVRRIIQPRRILQSDRGTEYLVIPAEVAGHQAGRTRLEP